MRDQDPGDPVRLIHADGNNNVRLALPLATLVTAGVDASSHDVVVGPSFQPGHAEVTVGAAGSRFLAEVAGLPADPDRWPETIDGIALIVAGAIPFATARIEEERRNGQRRRVAIYSGDLSRSQGESLDRTFDMYGGSSAPSTADPAIYDRLVT